MKFLCLTLGLLSLGISPLDANFLRHIYLTWQQDACRTITINVHGIKTPSSLFVYYDTQPHFANVSLYSYKTRTEGERPFTLPDERLLYHAELTALEPDRTYYFVISDGVRTYGNEMSFRTIPDSETPLFFVEGGDWENTLSAVALTKKAASLNPMAVWLGGDYPTRVFGRRDFKKWDEWLDMYTQNMVTSDGHLIPMVMAIGNHEVIGGFGQPMSQVPFFFHYFRQGSSQKSYFSLTFGKQLCLYVLDSGHVAEHGGDQKKWLAAELQKEAKVKMAIYHVPLFPSMRFAEKDIAYHTFYGFVEIFKNKAIADKLFSKEGHLGRLHWLPLFDQYSLTTAFEHHDHALKRTKLLRNGREDPRGTLYLGDGGWGSSLQLSPIQGYFHNYFSVLKGNCHFFWSVKIDKSRITYEAVTASGKVIDRFVQYL